LFFYIVAIAKVDLATRLSETSSLLASSQLELTSIKTKEAELRQKLDQLLSLDGQSREQLTTLKLQLSGQWSFSCKDASRFHVV